MNARCVAQVSVDSARLVRAVPMWFSRQYKWEVDRFTCQKRGSADGSVPFTWNVPGFGITGRGAIHRHTPMLPNGSVISRPRRNGRCKASRETGSRTAA